MFDVNFLLTLLLSSIYLFLSILTGVSSSVAASKTARPSTGKEFVDVSDSFEEDREGLEEIQPCADEISDLESSGEISPSRVRYGSKKRKLTERSDSESEFDGEKAYVFIFAKFRGFSNSPPSLTPRSVREENSSQTTALRRQMDGTWGGIKIHLRYG